MKTRTPEELKQLLADLRGWKPNDTEPQRKILESEALIKRALDSIEFLTGPPVFQWEDPKPAIVAKETFSSAYVDPWPVLLVALSDAHEQKKKLDSLFDRVTTLDNCRFEQCRELKEDMVKETSSLWNAAIVSGIILAVTTLVLWYHIAYSNS